MKHYPIGGVGLVLVNGIVEEKIFEDFHARKGLLQPPSLTN
jgi:hypothetical protein